MWQPTRNSLSIRLSFYKRPKTTLVHRQGRWIAQEVTGSVGCPNPRVSGIPGSLFIHQRLGKAPPITSEPTQQLNALRTLPISLRLAWTRAPPTCGHDGNSTRYWKLRICEHSSPCNDIKRKRYHQLYWHEWQPLSQPELAANNNRSRACSARVQTCEGNC